MNNKKMSSGQITGVGCDVSNCKYNTIDCKCSASQIKVQNDKATTSPKPSARHSVRAAAATDTTGPVPLHIILENQQL